MNKEDNLKEKFKQALISTIKVISEDPNIEKEVLGICLEYTFFSLQNEIERSKKHRGNLTNNKLSGKRIRRVIAEGITSGLFALHQAEIYHTDIKPENICVCPDNRGGYTNVKIIDYGLCQMFRDVRSPGSGTPRFIPNWLWKWDKSTGQLKFHDIWSVILSIFEMKWDIEVRGNIRNISLALPRRVDESMRINDFLNRSINDYKSLRGYFSRNVLENYSRILDCEIFTMEVTSGSVF